MRPLDNVQRDTATSKTHALLFLVSLELLINWAALTVSAGPLAADDLSLSLSSGHKSSQIDGSQQTKLMEQIMSDEFGHDFALSIKAMDQLASNLEAFVTREGMTNGVGKHEDLMTLWAASKGGSSLNVIVKELDYVMSTFWYKFKPLVETIIAQRPDQLSQNDLDFRCKRSNELAELKAMSAHSSIYSMYLDTFYSELHLHCLVRKLALIKNNDVAPSALVKQFVDIYLDLPTSKDPMKRASKELQEQTAHQLLAGHAFNFKLDTALAHHGPLSVAAQLVFDPRVAMSLTPSSNNIDGLLRELESDCRTHNVALSQIWGDFDGLASFLSSQTCNLADLNAKVKMAAPQLVYGSICSRLLELPR